MAATVIDLTKLCMYALLMVMGWGGCLSKKNLLYKSFIENQWYCNTVHVHVVMMPTNCAYGYLHFDRLYLLWCLLVPMVFTCSACMYVHVHVHVYVWMFGFHFVIDLASLNTFLVISFHFFKLWITLDVRVHDLITSSDVSWWNILMHTLNL